MDKKQAHQQEEAVGCAVVGAASVDEEIESLSGETWSTEVNLIRY